MLRQKIVGFLFLRNLVLAVLAGFLAGVLSEKLMPVKKGKSQDLLWGVIGAVLGGLGLMWLGGGSRLIATFLLELIMAFVFILLSRWLSEKK